MELSEKLFEAVFKLVTTESIFPRLPWMGNNIPKPLLTVQRLIENGADTSQSWKKKLNQTIYSLFYFYFSQFAKISQIIF